MRQHEINKRKKLKQKRRESSKSQVGKKHKQKLYYIYLFFSPSLPLTHLQDREIHLSIHSLVVIYWVLFPRMHSLVNTTLELY